MLEYAEFEIHRYLYEVYDSNKINLDLIVFLEGWAYFGAISSDQ